MATYSTSGKHASRRSASTDLPERAPPSTSVRRGRSGTAWYSPTVTVVPSGTARAPAAAHRRSSSRPGGLSWSRCTAITSVVGPAAPAARSRASASGRPSTSARTMSYGRCAKPAPVPAGAPPGGRYSSRLPSGPVTSYPVPGASIGTARTRCPLITASSRPSGTRPAEGSPGGSSMAGPSCGCVSRTWRTPASEWPARAPARTAPGVRSSSSAPSTSRDVAARERGPTETAQAAQGQPGRGSPSGVPVPSRVSSTRRSSRVAGTGARPATLRADSRRTSG